MKGFPHPPRVRCRHFAALVFHRSPEFPSLADVVGTMGTVSSGLFRRPQPLGHHGHRFLLEHRSFLWCHYWHVRVLCQTRTRLIVRRDAFLPYTVAEQFSPVEQPRRKHTQWKHKRGKQLCETQKKIEVLSPRQHITQRIFRQTFCLGLSHAVVDVLCTRCVTACFSFSGARTPEVCDSVSIHWARHSGGHFFLRKKK